MEIKGKSVFVARGAYGPDVNLNTVPVWARNAYRRRMPDHHDRPSNHARH